MAAPQHEAPVPSIRIGPWTEQDWLSSGPEPRTELVDGLLVMSPSASNPHQVLVLRIGAILDAAAAPGWRVLPEPNVRLGVDRVLIPDVAVLSRDHRGAVNDASDVALVVEIVSPGHAAVDRILKPRLYAEAGIRRYLRIEQDGPVGHLHELVDGTYRETATGPTIILTDPFPVTLDLPYLAR